MTEAEYQLHCLIDQRLTALCLAMRQLHAAMITLDALRNVEKAKVAALEYRIAILEGEERIK